MHRDPQEVVTGELIEGVVARVRERLRGEEADLLAGFVRQYFAQADPADLADRALEDLYGAALSHWRFLQRFESGAAALRVLNPRLEEHGWQSPHTVIEIVNDDMPFLVDSIAMELNRQGLTLHLIIHPLLRVARDAGGALRGLLAPDGAEEGRFESVIHAEVDRRSDEASLAALRDGLGGVLADVRAAVDDWKRMKNRLVEVSAEVEQTSSPQDAAQTVEDRAFLGWMAAGNFTFLGYRAYELVVAGGEDALRSVPGSGLGILRESAGERVSASFALLPAQYRAQARSPRLLILAKSNTRSTVHRAGYLDYVGVKRFDPSGAVIGEHRFLGLYTSIAYSAGPAEIPLLRRKFAHVIGRAGFLPGSHAAKTLAMILNQYPRDELFQIDEDALFAHAMGILRLGERSRVRVFLRGDAWGRFVSCLVYVPRERYNTELRHRIQQILMQALSGVSSEFSVQLSESALARLLIVVRTRPGSAPACEARELEARIVRATRRWTDDLRAALVERAGEERGLALFVRYGEAFPAGYREDCSVRLAVGDIELLETLAHAGGLALNLHAPLESPRGLLRLRLLHEGGPVALSDCLPMLERMGARVVDERPYRIERRGAGICWIHDIGMAFAHFTEDLGERRRAQFQEAFLRVWHGDAESDDFNRLVLGAGLGWREVMQLRAYAKYMRQAGFGFSLGYVEQVLAAHPDLAAALFELFRLRFDPRLEAGRDEAAQAQAQRIRAALDGVANLDEDRILRQFLAVIEATVRSNWFQSSAEGAAKPYLSFKLESRRVPGLPEPKPLFEIFVYSPRFEGVHLRGGKVARGGLRWSDRMEDFRTEVLGLVKAQMVKNTVIVPVGSKGGFVLKRAPAGDRDVLLREGIECYRGYLRGLLDLTDNLVGGKVVPPPDVVRHEPDSLRDDPYLVVAADKGTATFSDHANAVSRAYRFWLDDAFASGGSAGYDHKKMGITARGAWESVKRHFRELGHDTQTQHFSVVGIGDMSGDVFGNGMLLSRHIRLLAAFDHRHVFIDPEPDAQTSFVERERLFALPRSSWADYDAAKISAGGGVWPRSAKSIALSPQARAALGIEADSMTPAELMHAILLAPADLLYNGGIGTYVKARDESHAEVGDRANDAIRVNGADLRVRVVAEGGNLGLTQRGRIEYALGGGRINTDAIDNSAGVDTSDHEVNIKILLNSVMAEGELTEKQRNALLAEMTDEVAELVLRDNYFQTQALAVARAFGGALLEEQARYVRHLERGGRLNRAIEFLPGEEGFAERRAAGDALTAPELAVLLAYAKMELYDALLDSDAPEDPLLARSLAAYFPPRLAQRFADALARHPLRREIVATCVTNETINRVGPTFVFRLQEETGAASADIVRACTLAREVFGLPALWQTIEALDARVPAAVQSAMLIEAGRVVLRATQWFLRRRFYFRDLEQAVRDLAAAAGDLARRLDALLPVSDREAVQRAAAAFVERGAPAEVARRVAEMEPVFSALDIAEVARAVERSVGDVAEVYFALGGRLELRWLADQIAALPAEGHWQMLARSALRDELSGLAAELATEVFRRNPELQGAPALLQVWESHRTVQFARYLQVVAELRAAGALDMAMLSVAMRELRALA
jgi:glutamate dehydrogenase